MQCMQKIDDRQKLKRKEGKVFAGSTREIRCFAVTRLPKAWRKREVAIHQGQRGTSDAHLNRNANESVLFTKRMKPHFRRQFFFSFFLSSPARRAVDTRYSVVEAETALTFHSFLSFSPFFIYRLSLPRGGSREA